MSGLILLGIDKIVINEEIKWYTEAFLDSLDTARHIVDVLEDNKGQNIVLLDLRPDTVIADFFVLCTGTSDRQLRALTDYVRDQMREDHKLKPYSVEGRPESGWVLMDYGEVVVHLFTEEKRKFYDLEQMWEEVAHVLLSIQ